jgi:ankyrin repeat protein
MGQYDFGLHIWANLDVEDELFIACGERGELDYVKLLVDSFNPDVDEARGDDGWTCIEIAAAYGRVEIVKFLLERGADPNKKDFDGWTSLHAAAANGHVRVCRLLCEGGADLTIKTYDDEMVDTNYEGLTPAQVALQRGHVQVMRALEEFA